MTKYFEKVWQNPFFFSNCLQTEPAVSERLRQSGAEAQDLSGHAKAAPSAGKTGSGTLPWTELCGGINISVPPSSRSTNRFPALQVNILQTRNS